MRKNSRNPESEHKAKDELLHIRVGRGIRNEIETLISSGFFTSQTELVREAVRDLILKYKNLQNLESITTRNRNHSRNQNPPKSKQKDSKLKVGKF